MDTALSDQNGINAGIAEMAKLTFRPSSEEAGQNVSQNHGPGPGQKKPRLPRLFHKKSKTGCRGCRSRRVKVSLSGPMMSGQFEGQGNMSVLDLSVLKLSGFLAFVYLNPTSHLVWVIETPTVYILFSAMSDDKDAQLTTVLFVV